MTETRHATVARRVNAPSRAGDDVYVFPASFAQQRLWFLDQWEPDSAAYNVPAAFRFSVPLHIAAFERSLTAIALRHEALRTTFGVEDGEPVQIVEPEQPIALRTVDLTALPVTSREAEVQRLATAEIHTPFDLSTGPLLRALHLRLADRDHVVVFTIHHIVFDGWSMCVLLRELAAHCLDVDTEAAQRHRRIGGRTQCRTDPRQLGTYRIHIQAVTAQQRCSRTGVVT